MNLRQFLEHPNVQLPIERTNDDFLAFASETLDAYQALLPELSEPHDFAQEVRENISKIKAFSETAKHVIATFLEGHPSTAYTQFVEGLQQVQEYVHKQALKDMGPGIRPSDLGILYRVRKQPTGSLSRKDLFHIPFQLRHLVGTQRYSVPGLPCLYFGGSLFTCWEEMGRPPFHELQAAAFWLNPSQKVKLLNFSDRPKRLLLFVGPTGEILNGPRGTELLLTHLMLWPLVALASVIVKYPTGAFKAEYIVPQLLLQWITKEHDYDGICYFSTHVAAVTNYPLPSCNLVFPAKEIQPSGHCPKLSQYFHLTEPYGWELLRAVNAGEGMPGIAAPNFDFEFIEGRKEPYLNTEFGMVQTKLNKLAIEGLQLNMNGQPEFGSVTV